MFAQPDNNHWLFRPSMHQAWLNTLALIIGTVFSLSLLPLPFAIMLGIIFGPALLLWRHKTHKQTKRLVHAVGYDDDGWWLAFDCRRQQAGGPWLAMHKQSVRWRLGTIRGDEWVVLKWGWLPWQSIDVRPDGLPKRQDFQDLKRALHQAVEH